MAVIGRRIVTGVNSSGKSCVLDDGNAIAVLHLNGDPEKDANSSEIHWMWYTDEQTIRRLYPAMDRCHLTHQLCGFHRRADAAYDRNDRAALRDHQA